MLPAITSLNGLGGAIKNYADPVDPTTDEHVKFRNWYVTDVAAMGHTAARAMRSFVGVNGADPTDPASGFVHDALWGSTGPLKPPVARTGEGIWTVTWPTTVNTEMFGEDVERGGGAATSTIAVSLRRAWAQVECTDGTLRHATAEVTAANVVKVRGYLANGTPDDLTGATITVWAY